MMQQGALQACDSDVHDVLEGLVGGLVPDQFRFLAQQVVCNAHRPHILGFDLAIEEQFRGHRPYI